MEKQPRLLRHALTVSTKTDSVVLFGEVLTNIFPDKTVLGGAPFNVARHLKAFGLAPVLISRIGDDPLGHEVMGVMTGSGMETLGIQCTKKFPTGSIPIHITEKIHPFDYFTEKFPCSLAKGMSF